MGYLGATLTQVFTHARRTDVSLRDVTIARDGKRGLASANDVTYRKCAEDFGNLKKVSRVETCLGRRLLVFASLQGLGLVSHEMRWGGRWKSQNRKIVPLSPCVEEPLTSKVIKSFVPEQRGRYVFFEFRDSYVLSLWTFDVRFTHSHIMAMVHVFTLYLHQGQDVIQEE